MSPRKKDFGPEDLAEWTARAAGAIEKRYPFAFEPGELAQNPAFYCLLGRGARKGVGLSSASEKARLLLDDFFLDWFREGIVSPREAAQAASAYLLAQRRDAPEASRFRLIEIFFKFVLGWFWLGWIGLACLATFSGFLLESKASLAAALIHAGALGASLAFVASWIPPASRKIAVSLSLMSAGNNLRAGKTLGQQAAALPGQVAQGCGCYFAFHLGLALCSAIGVGVMACLGALGLPEWSAISWLMPAYSLTLLGVAWALANERRPIWRERLESEFRRIKSEDARD